MRLLRLTKWLALGGSVAAWMLYRRRPSEPDQIAEQDVGRPAAEPTEAVVEATVLPEDAAIDPGDPVQGIDEVAELRVEPLDIDALSDGDAVAAEDLAVFESALEGQEGEAMPVGDYEAVEQLLARKDAGELYGAHTPPALDREIPDGDASFDEGENWLEALNASATEFGPEVEEDVDVEDTADEPPHPSDTRDVPVADKGSAGVRGL